MGLFSSIFTSAGAANSSGYINPGASLGGLQSTSTGTSLTSVQPGGYITIGNAGSSTWATNASTLAHDHVVHTLHQYCQLIGWEFIHLYIPDIETNDPKVAILKLAKDGEVIKDVGVRLGDHNFYIMREPWQGDK